MSCGIRRRELIGKAQLQQLGMNTERQIGAAPLLMLVAATTPKRRRLYFPVAAVENFGPKMLRYSPRQLASQPTWLSSRQQVEHGAPVRDSVFSWLSWHCSVSSHQLLALETSFGTTQ